MSHQKHRQHLGALDYSAAFPMLQYPGGMRPAQVEALDLITRCDGRITLELPVGSGKTAIGYAFLRTLAEAGVGPLFYLVPTKTLVDQVIRLHPDLVPAYGRNEHVCLYYPDESLRADQVPCLTLADCPHRVDIETGAVQTPGVTPCPYYAQKHAAYRAPIVVCTMAFYLFHQLYQAGRWGEAQGLVIDEAHRMADVVRNCLSFEITDYHLWRAADLLAEIDPAAGEQLHVFARKMLRIIKRKPAQSQTLLEDHEIAELIGVLETFDSDRLARELQRAVVARVIDPRSQWETLRQLEVILRDLRRYLRSLEYALPGDQRGPLNYTYAYYEEDKPEGAKAQYRLVIKAYYVASLIERILAPRTVAYSATIGSPDAFTAETGIKAPVYSIGSDFPAERTRIFLPTDTPNLAMKARSRQDLTRSLRRIARTCRRFADSGIRSLVVVISEAERQKFLMLAGEEGVSTLTYGNGTPAKEVAARFRDGTGDVLVGTAAQYGEGVDLPRQVAPVIFMLRPGYQRPDDPMTLFEERRFTGSRVWSIRNWRVMNQALQVRGRNIRSAEDLGVTFFISQQFGRFLRGSLPKWLESAYRGDLNFEQCVEEAEKMLQ